MERRAGKSLMRLFIAFNLSGSIRKSLSTQITHLGKILGTTGVKWVNPRGIHLTLKFLGETQEQKIAQIQNSLGIISSRFSPFDIQIGNFGCFPHSRKPRVIWIGVQDMSGNLLKVHHEIEMEFRKIGFKAENRPFSGHLTLGRIKRNLDPSDRRTLISRIGEINIGDLGTETVEEICLIRSILKPTGAEYTQVGAYKFVEKGT